MGFNYGEMMKQAKIMQKQMEKVQDELKEMQFEASSGGGAVKITVNGEQEVLKVKVNTILGRLCLVSLFRFQLLQTHSFPACFAMIMLYRCSEKRLKR